MCPKSDGAIRLDGEAKWRSRSGQPPRREARPTARAYGLDSPDALSLALTVEQSCACRCRRRSFGTIDARRPRRVHLARAPCPRPRKRNDAAPRRGRMRRIRLRAAALFGEATSSAGRVHARKPHSYKTLPCQSLFPYPPTGSHWFNPFTPQYRNDPHPHLHRLRGRAVPSARSRTVVPNALADVQAARPTTRASAPTRGRWEGHDRFFRRAGRGRRRSAYSAGCSKWTRPTTRDCACCSTAR